MNWGIGELTIETDNCQEWNVRLDKGNKRWIWVFADLPSKLPKSNFSLLLALEANKHE
jgi:hypothetical protein